MLYYSQTGATKVVAEKIAETLGADIEAFDVDKPYDGNFQETIDRCLVERGENFVPAIVPIKADLKKYDVVFLGYPVWFGTYAPPVAALLKEYNLAGKKVVPFCTFGSGGLESSTADLKIAIPEAEVAPGYGVRNARLSAVDSELNRYFIENGWVEGSVTALDDYAMQEPVTEKEVAIFNAACGDYPMPLGTPVSYGWRQGENGSVDFLFTVSTLNAAGEQTLGHIYVTLENAEEVGAVADAEIKAEFIKAVR
ncbi:MAG: hypothetical protein HUJ95_01790 [Bacteroidales bacterium]|nr:hypothetical protein [Bacteroidales bacterium]